MKNNLFFMLSIFMLFAFSSQAQQLDIQSESTSQAITDMSGKNLVKLNVTALALKNYSFQYERVISQKTTVAMGLRFMPKGKLPLKSLIRDLIDDENLNNEIDNFKTGNFALTPEFRYYTGEEALRGFYIAPFVRYALYSANVPFEFDVDYDYDDPDYGTISITESETIDLDGKINAFTVGVMIGAQWKLSKLVYLDWWILGPQYGGSSGNINGKKSLSPEEQEALRDQLTELDDIPIVKAKSTVTSEGAKVDFSGPWAGLRAGLSIGFRF